MDEGSVISNPTNRILSSTDGAHWSAPNHIFGETTAVGVSEEKSDYDYNYTTEFQIWKENKEFERQIFSMSQTPLDSPTVGMNMTNKKISPLDSTPVGAKIPDPKTLTLPI